MSWDGGAGCAFVLLYGLFYALYCIVWYGMVLLSVARMIRRGVVWCGVVSCSVALYIMGGYGLGSRKTAEGRGQRAEESPI